MPNTQSRWFEITRLSSQAEPRRAGRTRLGWRLPWQTNRGRFTPFQAERCSFLGEVLAWEVCKHCWCIREEDRDPFLVAPGVSADRGQQPAVPAVCRGAGTWCSCQKPSVCAGPNGLGSAVSGCGCVGAAGPPRASLTCGEATRLGTGPHKWRDTSTSALRCSLCRDGVWLLCKRGVVKSAAPAQTRL